MFLELFSQYHFWRYYQHLLIVMGLNRDTLIFTVDY